MVEHSYLLKIFMSIIYEQCWRFFMCLIFVGQGYPRKLFNLKHFPIYSMYMYNRDLYSLVKHQYFIIFTFRQVLLIYSHIHYHKDNNIPYIANHSRWKSFADGQAISNLLENFRGLLTPLILKRKYAHVHKQLSQVATVPLIYNFTFTCVYTQGDTTQVL